MKIEPELFRIRVRALMLNPFHVVLICLLFSVSVWSFYNLPILGAGVRRAHRNRHKRQKHVADQTFPSFSIIVPVKNEEKVIGRLLNAVKSLNYPSDKKEIIIVEDGSTDRTVEICTKYAEQHTLHLKVLRKSRSNGKPSALNYGIKAAKGEIIGFFDADNVPADDVLLNASSYFEDSNVAAVQGRTLSINSDENMLTKFLSYEETVWCEAYLQGKDALSLFVHLKGSCQFIRRSLLESVNGFDEGMLAEDMDLSARFAERGYRIRYASDVRSLQESPADLKHLVSQRTRWYRGTMEVALRYGRLMAKLSRKNLDAEATLFGPFVLIASLLTYFGAFYTFFLPFPAGAAWQFINEFATLGTTITILLCGLGLIYATKPKRLKSLLWLPFIYFYWSSQALIASYAMLLILLRRPRKWVKTEKKGVVTLSAHNLN
jgi:cellulose synthase/poly-beta-1,6-N-acetylglucosamine synthase-like glycosyltransferase